MAYETALGELNMTSTGQIAIGRYATRGRKVCFEDDFAATGNIGPLFVSESMTIKDNKNGTCLTVASLSEGPTKLTSHIFPGIHYCKLISPARFIDYIMIDSLKAHSGCLNTKSVIAEVFLQ